METPGRPIANEILAYLVKHPEAQDTLEGITEWWLLEQQIQYAVAEVDGALNKLVAGGLLVTRRCADGRTYYGLNRIADSVSEWKRALTLRPDNADALAHYFTEHSARLGFELRVTKCAPAS